MSSPPYIRWVFAAIVAAGLTGCASPRGSDWATADFNKYGLNYDRFPTEQLQVGQPKGEVLRILGSQFKAVEASEDGEVLSWDRWVSVPGPDYVGERLVVRFRDGRLVKWRTTSDTVSIVPRSW